MKKLTFAALLFSLFTTGCLPTPPTYTNDLSNFQVELAELDKKKLQWMERAKTENCGEYPENYKELIQEYIKTRSNLVDPESARLNFDKETIQEYIKENNYDTIDNKSRVYFSNFVGTPVKSFTNLNSNFRIPEFCYLVGILINAKNSYGGYTGNKLFAISIKNGKVINSICIYCGG